MPITNTNTKPTAPFVVSISPTSPVAGGGFTIGLDLMDRSHYVCVLDAAGEIPHEGSMLNDQVALARYPLLHEFSYYISERPSANSYGRLVS